MRQINCCNLHWNSSIYGNPQKYFFLFVSHEETSCELPDINCYVVAQLVRIVSCEWLIKDYRFEHSCVTSSLLSDPSVSCQGKCTQLSRNTLAVLIDVFGSLEPSFSSRQMEVINSWVEWRWKKFWDEGKFVFGLELQSLESFHFLGVAAGMTQVIIISFEAFKVSLFCVILRSLSCIRCLHFSLKSFRNFPLFLFVPSFTGNIEKANHQLLIDAWTEQLGESWNDSHALMSHQYSVKKLNWNEMERREIFFCSNGNVRNRMWVSGLFSMKLKPF